MTVKKLVELYDGEVRIYFYPKSHRYRLEGESEYLTSVTSISGIVDKSRALMAWVAKIAAETGDPYGYKKQQKEALSVGTVVHKWIEKYTKGITDKPPEDEKAYNGVMAFLDWVNKEEVKFIDSERIVYSREMNYIGTLDAIAYVNGRLCIIDYKTSKRIYELETRLQTVGYLKAYEEETNEEVEDRIIINLGKETGDFQISHYKKEELIHDMTLFTAAFILKKRSKYFEIKARKDKE